jgi:hypothetical protein
LPSWGLRSGPVCPRRRSGAGEFGASAPREVSRAGPLERFEQSGYRATATPLASLEFENIEDRLRLIVEDAAQEIVRSNDLYPMLAQPVRRVALVAGDQV